jgi:small GTP-binding protein
MKILDDAQERLLADERRTLGELVAALARLEVTPDDQETLLRSVRQLDELFLLVVVGEFNAGKSAFINALLGARVLEEGVTPTTSRIGLIRHGAAVAREVTSAGLEVIAAPVELLREINIVDTPGTNAVRREHEALTREFVPRSDLVLFVTSADRPFTESERAFLESIRDWGKKVVVVLNKVDIFERPEEVAEVVAFISASARELLGTAPEIFPVSGRQAFRAKEKGDAAALAATGFGRLERFIAQTLDEGERIRLKLMNPLGVGLRLLERHLEQTEARLGLLKDDFAAIEEIDSQLALYREDLARDFRFRLADVDNVLKDFEKRGADFFEDTLRIGRVFDLMNQARVKSEFERKVVADLPQVVEKRVDEVIDWLVASDMKQWRAVSERLARREAEHADRMLGRMHGSFETDRARLLETVKREAQRAVESYDKDAEGRRLAENVRDAVASTAIIQVGALSLGTIVALLATSSAVDVTGIMAAGAISVLGLLVLPARRRQATIELRVKVHRMREQLMGALTAQFDREVERSAQKVQEAVGPYTRFVRGERERLTATRDELRRIRAEIERLRAAIDTRGAAGVASRA